MSAPVTVLLTALAPIAWGTTYIVTSELLPPGHPLFAALLRALPAGLLALAIGRALPRGVWWARAALLGALNIGAFFPLLFLAAERLPGGVAAAVGGAQPVIVVLLSAVVLRTPVRPRPLAIGAAGAVGVALVVLGPSAALDPIGVAAAIGGTASMALGLVLTKRWGRPEGVGAISYAGWQLTAGGLVLLPAVLAVEGVPAHIDGAAVAGYVWLATAGGIVAYTLWFRGIQRLPAFAAGLLGLLSPVVATLIGVAVLGETFTPVQAAGIALALGALIIGQVPARRAQVVGGA
ncbi:EamA family transporter [Microbacterium barkeri]|uniref:EamA family transporter n=1 Tax=Microbacterium barkeri TaxID=33917 RepID=UPI0024AEF041|nr:EamA family transporter [Microbacterium barkeri]MDI6941981.1 EamA family transporter [Microbacterium barkeri]